MSGEESEESSGSSDECPYMWIDNFVAFCASADLSLEEIQRMTEDISSVPDDLDNSPFFHIVCLNENVTLEIVEHLLRLFPYAANMAMDIDDEGITSAHPIHLACRNKHCPSSVILLLLDRHPMAVLDFCFLQWSWENFRYGEPFGGFPLHHYLDGRDEVELDIVKKLMPRNVPRYLLAADADTKCTPIHTLMWNKNVGRMFDVVKFLVDTCPSSLRKIDTNGQLPLHLCCSNKTVTPDIVRYLLREWPESVQQRSLGGTLPLHHLCMGSAELDDATAVEVLQLLLDAHPAAVSQTEEGDGGLPIHVAAGAGKSPAFIKLLVEAYPVSVKVVDGCGSLPFHSACDAGHPETVKYLLNLYPESIHKRGSEEFLPIHHAAFCGDENSVSIINILLSHDPECASKVVLPNPGPIFPGLPDHGGSLPLHLVCSSNHHSGVGQYVYSLYPEAILTRNGAGKLPITVLRECTDGLPLNPDGTAINVGLQQRNLELMAFLEKQHTILGQRGIATGER